MNFCSSMTQGRTFDKGARWNWRNSLSIFLPALVWLVNNCKYFLLFSLEISIATSLFFNTLYFKYELTRSACSERQWQSWLLNQSSIMDSRQSALILYSSWAGLRNESMVNKSSKLPCGFPPLSVILLIELKINIGCRWTVRFLFAMPVE